MINFSNKEQIAIKTKSSQFTYADLNTNINKYASLYPKCSFERIAILCENRPEWIFAFYAGWQNKSTIVPIDYMASNNDITFVLNDCKPNIIFTSNEKIDDMRIILKNLDYQPKIINFDNVEFPQSTNNKEWKEQSDNEKTAVIIYTSGTTGSPKGVMLSYTNLLSNLDAVCYDANIYNKDQQVLMLLPLHHIFPLAGTMLAPLYIGAPIIMSPSIQSSDLLETLKNNNVNLMVGVPRLYELIYKGLKNKINASIAGRLLFAILKTFPNRKLALKVFKKVHDGFGGHLEYMIAGGAALSPEVGIFFKTLGFKILEGFGMTESSPIITFNRPDNFKIGTPGQQLGKVKIEIRDGEIVAKGPNVMQGYFNRPKETSDVLKDGWLYTGDLGYVDKDGFLYITGRKKEIIVLSNGKNINPVEVEDKLERISDLIDEVAIHLINDNLHALIVPDYSELAKANIKDIEAYFKNTIIAEYNKHASSYKRVMQFTLLKTEIPRTRLGKIKRFKLSDLLETPQKERFESKDPTSEEYKSIKEFIEDQSNTKISPDDHLEFDIALDSLGKLSLIDFIDKSFGIDINEEKLLKFPSVKKLVEFIADNKSRHQVESINWSEILKHDISLEIPKSSLAFHLLKSISKFFFQIHFKFKTDGINNIPKGACIISPNHQSYFDAMLVASCLNKKTIQETYFYGKKKHINNSFLKFLARNSNVFIMDLDNLKESIQMLAEVLRMGKKVIIFPEGTRTKDGKLGEFKKMFTILSVELNVPIVPVTINGAYKAYYKRNLFPKLFSPISITFSKAINPDKHNYNSLSDTVREEVLLELKNGVGI